MTDSVPGGNLASQLQQHVPEIRDRAVSIGWIAGLLIIICVLWIVVRPAQARNILRTVNRVFIAANDSRRVNVYVPKPSVKHGPLGYQYSLMGSTDQFFVFGAMKDGILVPCGAVISADGKVNEIIPLSAHARQVLENMPDGTMRMYISRIEKGNRK